MLHDNPRSIAKLGAYPIHPMLVPFPIACFAGAFVTDLVYWRTAAVMWETSSIWLLTAGLVAAGFAVVAGLIDFVGSKRIRTLKPAWPHVLGNALATSVVSKWEGELKPDP